MDIYSIIIIVGFALSIILGLLMGFGRVLRFITGGIVGIIFSLFICIMFGGIIANIPFISDLIARGNEYFGEIAEILAKINVATIIYYIALFIVVQILRIIVIKTISKIFTPEKNTKLYGVRNFINRALGLIVLGGAFVLSVYLILAVVALLTDVEGVANFLTSLQNDYKTSICYMLYANNPIDLTVLFG